MEKVMETKFFNVKNIRMYYNELFTKVANEFSNMTDKDILSYDKEDLNEHGFEYHCIGK